MCVEKVKCVFKRTIACDGWFEFKQWKTLIVLYNTVVGSPTKVKS